MKQKSKWLRIGSVRVFDEVEPSNAQVLKVVEEARETGRTITCYDCKTWHTADAIREALGETAL